MRVTFCISGLGRGHAARCRPLIAALGERGHACTAIVPGRRAGAMLADLVPVTGPPPGYRERVAARWRGGMAFHMVRDLGAALSAYQADVADASLATVAWLDEALAAARPDVVVVDEILLAGPVARAHGLPVAQVTHAPMLPGTQAWDDWTPPDPRERVPPALPAVAAAMRAAGLPEPGALTDLLDGDLVVVPAHPLFGTVPGAVHTRPDDDVGAPLEERLSGHVVVSAGGDGRRAGDFVAAALATGRRVVVPDGAGRLPAALAGDPRVLALGLVPMAAVLEGAVAAVHHGGAGVTHACLTAGVPAVAVPSTTEQERSARRVEAIGAGRHVPVSDAPLEALELRPGFVTLGHEEPRRLPERLAQALGDLLADAAAPAAAREAGEGLDALGALPGVAPAVEALAGQVARA